MLLERLLSLRFGALLQLNVRKPVEAAAWGIWQSLLGENGPVEFLVDFFTNSGIRGSLFSSFWWTSIRLMLGLSSCTLRSFSAMIRISSALSDVGFSSPSRGSSSCIFSTSKIRSSSSPFSIATCIARVIHLPCAFLTLRFRPLFLRELPRFSAPKSRVNCGSSNAKAW